MSPAKPVARVTTDLKSRARPISRKALAWGMGAAFIITLFQLAGAFDLAEFKSVDARFELLRGPRPLAAPVCVVAIDDESLNGWTDAANQAEYMPERWIWPRDFHARLIRNLKEAGAKLVAFDVVFSESSKRFPQQDLAFAQAAKEAGNVVFGVRYVPKENGSIKSETLIQPLKDAELDEGDVNSVPGSDNYMRNMRPLFYDSSGRPDPSRPNLDLAVLRQLRGGKDKISYDANRNQVMLGAEALPLNDDHTMDINFAGGPGTVPTFPYHDVFYKTMDMSVFKGKVVYVGSTSEILHDNYRTSFCQNVEKMAGVEIHCHLLDTLLTGQFLRHAPALTGLLLTLLLGLLTTLMTYRVKPSLGVVVAGAVVVLYAAVAGWAFVGFNYVLPMAGPLVAVLFTYLAVASYRVYKEEKDARATRRMFSRYVSKQIVDEILKNPDAVKLGGELKEVTILFSDVRGFTTMSERLSAPEVVEVLNQYLTAMVDIVLANGGTVDKYVGDAIMAVWGSPLPDPQHRRNALRTAVQMMEVLQELQVKWSGEGKPHIDIGIGLNTGHVVAGNMGHPEHKMDYTVIGDDVNLAARMESANKEMKSHVLITGSTYAGCEDLVEVVAHPPLHVKGKEAAIEVYEVVGWKKQGRAAWAVPLP